MKNITGRKFSTIRCHASVRIGPTPAKFKEVNTIIAAGENVDLEICQAGIVMTSKSSGEETLIPFANITQAVFEPVVEDKAEKKK